MTHSVTRSTGSTLLKSAAAAATAATLLAAPMLASGSATAAPAPAGAKARAASDIRADNSGDVPFTTRYRKTLHGGITRAANSIVTCTGKQLAGKVSCAKAQAGGVAYNQHFNMRRIDVDNDPTTVDSSSATVHLASDARVAMARLYWGANLHVGTSRIKHSPDNGWVKFKAPGERNYTKVHADERIGYITTAIADAYHASADVTSLVRRHGGGSYTVADLDAAIGNSADGAWGGWTLLVVYERACEPTRRVRVWDGYQAIKNGGTQDQSLQLTDLAVPRKGKITGRLGFLVYDGDRGLTGDRISIQTNTGPKYVLHNGLNPANNPMNSTISNFGKNVTTRFPDYQNTLGYDSDWFDISPALRPGDDTVTATLHPSPSQGYQIGAVWAQLRSER